MKLIWKRILIFGLFSFLVAFLISCDELTKLSTTTGLPSTGTQSTTSSSVITTTTVKPITTTQAPITTTYSDQTLPITTIPSTTDDTSSDLTTTISTDIVTTTVSQPIDVTTVAKVSVSAIIVSGSSRIQAGTSSAYSAQVFPENATDKQVVWSVVPGTGQATINASGVLVGTSAGTVTVVATASNQVIGSRTVTITPGKINVETVTISGPNEIALNHTGVFIANVLPVNATDQTVMWSVSPLTGNATITQNGTLTPSQMGTVVVVAIVDGVPAEKTITITSAIIPLSSVSVVAPENIIEFEEHEIEFTVSPEDATYSTVSWAVINGTGEAVISPAGLLTAMKPGTVTIRVTVDNVVGFIEKTILDRPNLVTEFVTSRNGYFYEGESETPFRFLGTNNYNLHYKSDAMIDDVIIQAADMGIKVIRMWAFFDGWEDEGRANYAYGQIAPGVYDKTPKEYFGETLYDRNTGLEKDPVHILDRVDYTIRRAGQYGIRVELVLTNYYPEFGGMQMYANWYNTLNPGANVSKTAFYTNETMKGWYKDWISYVANRTNQLTGVKYKDDPTIFSWGLANEPDGAGVPTWAAEMSAYLKNTVGVKQMVTASAQGSLGNAPATLEINKNTAEGRIAPDDDFSYSFVRSGIGGSFYGYGTAVNHWALLQIDTLDYVTAHLYVDHWGVSNDRAIEYGEKFIKDHIALAKYWGKPFVLEEYGAMRASMSESKRVHRDLAYDVWNRAVYEMGGAGSMFWILTGIEDSPDADANGNYPDFDGFRVLNDGGSTSLLLKKYAQLFNNEIESIEREARVYLLSPLLSEITKSGNYKIEAKVIPEDKVVANVYLYVHGQAPISMTAQTSDPYRTGIYSHTLTMTNIEPGEDYTIKVVVKFTDDSTLETEVRNIRRYKYLELDTLYDMDFNSEQQINFQTFGSYEATLRSINHNKTLEMLQLDVLNLNVNWSEHKVKLIAFPLTSGGLPMVPNTFRVQYTTYYNKAIVDALPNSGSCVLKNYIALEPGWVKTGIDQNNVSIATIRTNAAKDDSDPTKRSDYGIRWIDLNQDQVATDNE
ncbi:MAG: cellulase family glycosylhydrolase [Acholeplasmataceae bacterium]|nr:cellulase family glycosylhydrolase [Acholeplasmataceae bacterium]